MSWEVTAEILPAAIAVLIGCGIFAVICAGLIVKSRVKGVWGNHINPMPFNEPPTVSDLIDDLKVWRVRQQIGPSNANANRQLVGSASEQ